MTEQEREYFERLRRARSVQEQGQIREAFAQMVLRDAEKVRRETEQESRPITASQAHLDATYSGLTLEKMRRLYQMCLINGSTWYSAHSVGFGNSSFMGQPIIPDISAAEAEDIQDDIEDLIDDTRERPW